MVWGYPGPPVTFLRGLPQPHPTASVWVCPAKPSLKDVGDQGYRVWKVGWKRAGRTRFDLNQFVGQARNPKLQD